MLEPARRAGASGCSRDLVIATRASHRDTLAVLTDSAVLSYDWPSRPAIAPLPGLAGGRVCWWLLRAALLADGNKGTNTCGRTVFPILPTGDVHRPTLRQREGVRREGRTMEEGVVCTMYKGGGVVVRKGSSYLSTYTE